MSQKYFIGNVALENGTGLDVVIIPLRNTEFKGRWEKDTDLFMLCIMQNNSCCTFRPSDHFSRYVKKLRIPEDDGKLLAQWLNTNISY